MRSLLILSCDPHLEKKILGALEEFGLDTSYLRGQAFDGAGNMVGKYIGAAAIIQST